MRDCRFLFSLVYIDEGKLIGNKARSGRGSAVERQWMEVVPVKGRDSAS